MRGIAIDIFVCNGQFNSTGMDTIFSFKNLKDSIKIILEIRIQDGFKCQDCKAVKILSRH